MFIKTLKIGISIGIIVLLAILFLDFYIIRKTSNNIYRDINNISTVYTGLVLGAKVYNDGRLSGILKDRVDVAYDLYKNKKIKRFLLSGDHGRKEYDEVNNMKLYLIKKGIPERDIFLDHAGFDTYNSLYRAKHIFNVKDVIIVTQEFHIKRATYIALSLGLSTQGMVADKHKYTIAKRMVVREMLANVKAYLELNLSKKPYFMGNKIPITGESKLSYD